MCEVWPSRAVYRVFEASWQFCPSPAHCEHARMCGALRWRWQAIARAREALRAALEYSA